MDITTGEAAPIEPLALRPHDAAKAMSIGLTLLEKLTREEGLPCIAISTKCRMYPVAEMRAWLRERATGSKA